MSTEKNDARNAKSGISEEVLKEIDAQYAIIDSAVKLINQQVHNTENNSKSNKNYGGAVYSMEGLQKWVHYYTKRRKLICPHCKDEEIFYCDNCGNEYEYHDEL